MILRPITSEKAVKLIDMENTLLFETDRSATKDAIKKEIESLFGVKVIKIRSMIKANKKIAFVRLNKATPASDLASKLGMI